MGKLLFFVTIFISTAASAQVLTSDRMSVLAYEDMSDWMRRFSGIYVMDYGVVGAPAIIRPWGFRPWLAGVERDGIPWNRFSDGLYDSNLDSPDELAKLTYVFDGVHPLGTFALQTRSIVGDTAMTEVRLREGYYGFGRVDFAHAQGLTSRLSAEGRGRLFWYNGLRENISKSRSYNLAGRFRYKFSDQWHATLEYGGANTDVQSPNEVRVDGFLRRPQIYAEREFGTIKAQMQTDCVELTIGAHLRQDRELREEAISKTVLFGLREQYSYGFVDGRFTTNVVQLDGRAAIEHAAYNFLELPEEKTTNLDLRLGASRDFSLLKVSAKANTKPALIVADVDSVERKNYGVTAEIESQRVLGVSVRCGAAVVSQTVPRFWQVGGFSIENRQLFVDDAFSANRYYGGLDKYRIGPDLLSAEFKALNLGLNWASQSSTAGLGWQVISGLDSKFEARNDTLYLTGERRHRTERGPAFNCDIRVFSPLRLQSWSAMQCDPDDIARATELRSFTRLLFSQDFFKAPLHVDSYVGYEHIGRHSAMSDSGTAILGPAHLVHFRIEGTIEGVTLIWGVENMTAQHYMYLPGYLMIRKEEYFGLKWTLKF